MFERTLKISVNYISTLALKNINIAVGLIGRVFANGPGDLSSIPGRVIPKIQKMVLDTSLFNTQHDTYQE